MEVFVLVTKPLNTTKDANEFVTGLITGMKKNGYIGESATDTEIEGFPARHLIGEFRSDEYEGAYLADTKILFSDAGTVTISVKIDDARGGRELADSPLDWISVSGSPVTLKISSDQASTSFSIGEKLGRYTVYVALAVALVTIIRSRLQSAKKAKN